MVLTFIGLGLYDETDITVRGLKAIKAADKVYFEEYTSTLSVSKNDLEEFYGKPIISADRYLIEQNCDALLEEAKTKAVAFLVAGDAFCATTHSDLFLRAFELGVEVNVIHNASIINSIAACGLQSYRFGQTVSIPFFEANWRPDSFYEKIKANVQCGLHTLCLLDIKVKEQTETNMMKGNNIFEPPRFMSINVAAKQLLEVEEKKKQNICTPERRAFAVARMGALTQEIVSGTLAELQSFDIGEPLHSLVICADELHEVEKSFYDIAYQKLKESSEGPERANEDM